MELHLLLKVSSMIYHQESMIGLSETAIIVKLLVHFQLLELQVFIHFLQN